MTFTHKVWVLKRIDELGNCYHTIEVKNYNMRNKFIREWLCDERNYTRMLEGDVEIILKRNGEELWFYEDYRED